MDENTMIEALTVKAYQAAGAGAADYLRKHGLEAEGGALASCVRAWVKIKWPEAVRDAREAVAAHMPDVAVQTFVATMVLAGIEAAKEAGFPKAA